MAEKVKCPKCGKLCGATYIERHKAKCRITEEVPKMDENIPTEPADDAKFETIDLIAELAGVDDEILDNDPQAEITETPPIETQSPQDAPGAGGIIGVALVIGVLVISITFVIKMLSSGGLNDD